jgi:hypothetical protein
MSSDTSATVRLVSKSTGIITTIVGTGVPAPTLPPTPAPSPAVVKATKTISGVTDSPQSQADFKSVLLAVLPAGCTVTDLTVTALRRRRRLLAGVVVSYTVTTSAPGVSASSLSGTLKDPATLSTMTTTLSKAGYTSAAVQPPAVTTVSEGSSSSGAVSNMNGDGGRATAAQIIQVTDITVAANGDLYLVDSYKVRIVSKSTGIITTVAGNGDNACSGGAPIADGAAATSGALCPYSIAVPLATCML